MTWEFEAEVFDVAPQATVNMAAPPVLRTSHVAASTKGFHCGWDTVGDVPKKGSVVRVTIDQAGEASLRHQLTTLQQRIAGALTHLDRCRAHGNDVVRTEAIAAIDVLRGQASA